MVAKKKAIWRVKKKQWDKTNWILNERVVIKWMLMEEIGWRKKNNNKKSVWVEVFTSHGF